MSHLIGPKSDASSGYRYRWFWENQPGQAISCATWSPSYRAGCPALVAQLGYARHARLRVLVAQAVSEERWVVDGNYRVVRDLVWGRATTVIWLNYPLWRVMWRLMRRTLYRVLTKELLFSGNRETVRKSFLSRDSILWYVLTHYYVTRAGYRQIFDAPTFPYVAFVELKNPADTVRYLASFASVHG